MQHEILLNDSDSTILVHGINYDDIVGELYPHEAFCWIGGEGSVNAINFLGPDGNYSFGYIYDGTTAGITDYPYGTEQIYDSFNDYYTFIMRRTMDVFDANGDYWGQVAGGCRVACMTNMAGDSNTYLKGINFVENTAGEWIAVITDDDHKYGYVDTGLRSGSSPTSIALYGSW